MLDNKILVVGGGRRVGRLLSDALSNNFEVWYTARNRTSDIYPNHYLGYLDVTAPSDDVVLNIYKKGITDIVVSASVMYMGDVYSISPDKFNQMVDVHIKGTFNLLKMDLPYVRTITFILDTMALDPMSKRYTAMSATRMAQVALIKQGALYNAYARVNGIACGYMLKPNNTQQALWDEIVSENSPDGQETKISDLVKVIELIVTNTLPISGSIIELNRMEHLVR